MEPNKEYDNSLNNLESDNSEQSTAAPEEQSTPGISPSDKYDSEGSGFSSPDKYLALEQPGVTYTQEGDPLSRNPDHLEYQQHGQNEDLWDANAQNSRNSEAFNQDEVVLRDNIDLDEDQSTSISSDDDFDAETNTTDGV